MIRMNFRSAGRLLLLGAALLLFSFTVLHQTPADQVKTYYADHLRQLHAALLHFRTVLDHADEAECRAEFAACRAAYKPLEFVVEYYYPTAAQRINGAALPEAEPSEPDQVLLPSGFQVLEEYVFSPAAEVNSRDFMRRELDNLLFQVRYLQAQEPTLAFTQAEVFDALRLNLYRLASKGITGFDSPVALASLPEAAVTLESTRQVLACFDVPATLDAQLRGGVAAVRAPGATAAGFNRFDRAAFFVRYFNPMLTTLRQVQEQQRIPFVAARRAIRPTAATYFAADAFDPTFFAPADAAPATPAVLALGRALFQEPALSGHGRSCVSCHAPDKAYTDGLKVNKSLLDGVALERNTPTLLNAALQPALFYDGRVRFLEDQVHEVVSNRAEMGGQLSAAGTVLRRKGNYARLFAQAFADEPKPLTDRNIRRALAAYVRSLTGLNSRFDHYMRGDTTALNATEIRGFNLFMGKAQCGTCHYAPLFSGAVGPLYDKAESEVLGVPATPDTLHPTLDPDQGKYALYRIAHQRYAFKTPTVRNAARTAPYMHNGVYRTLDEVLDFYDRGGGAGLGLAVPTQTLGPDRLNLTTQEKQAIITFIQALNDESE